MIQYTIHIRLVLLFVLIVTLSFTLQAQQSLLRSGPMLGYSDFREVLVWVQTNEEADVKIGYWKNGVGKKYTSSERSLEANDFIVKLFPHEVDYGSIYQYEVYINDVLLDIKYPLEFETQTLWQYRTDPPEINFAIGSCTYINDERDNRPGKAYGSGYAIFDEIAKKDPNFMVWLGDNTYLRVPDFFTKRGIHYRYAKDRSVPELQRLLGSVHNYAIWDDHDYGPNDADYTYPNKKLTEAAFNLYWGNLNTNVTGKGGITGSFLWGDAQFFLMDNRYFRDPNNSLREGKALLGEDQLNWLIDALVSSSAAFKFVCIGGQTINNAAVYENYATYPDERERLLKRISDEKIEGVIFLSGDRHHSEISKMKRRGAYPLIDITSSPLTSGTHSKRAEGNTNLVEGTDYFERNFGIINISGPFRNRMLEYTLFDATGNKVYDFKISEAELKYQE